MACQRAKITSTTRLSPALGLAAGVRDRDVGCMSKDGGSSRIKEEERLAPKSQASALAPVSPASGNPDAFGWDVFNQDLHEPGF